MIDDTTVCLEENVYDEATSKIVVAKGRVGCTPKQSAAVKTDVFI